MANETLRDFTLNLLIQKCITPLVFKRLLSNLSIGDIFLERNNLSDLLHKDIIYSDLLIDKLKSELIYRGIKFHCLWEEDYPTNLKEIDDPPIILFFKGNYNKDLIDKSISIIGTRKSTDYGKEVIKLFIKDFVLHSLGIVSGMALGIDREVHIECSRYKGFNIAVLAGSVDKPIPTINSDVYKLILNSGGCILSEYLPESKIFPLNFVLRNRIISGLSLGSVVVEAPIKSGSLITARFANEQSREVFAIPGDIRNKQSEGSNNLIKDGLAKLVSSSSDVLNELNFI